MSAMFKSRASSLAKIAELPRYHHPADLINQAIKPISQQNKQINGQLQFGKGLYNSDSYEALIKSIISTRKGYRLSKDSTQRNQIASQQYGSWNSYLTIKTSQLPQELKINQTQKQKMYETLLITKQRNQERLALNRFIGFFNQYSKGFKFDLQFHPLIMMRLTYPHWGYFNLFPSVSAYRLKLDEMVELFEEFVVASVQREQGNSLHSSEILSFIFWKLYTRKLAQRQSAQLSLGDFCEMLTFFKFNTNKQLFRSQFAFSIAEGELEHDKVRFNLWRQVFLDRNL